MLIFYLCVFFFIGVCLYLSGIHIKINPYSQLKRDYKMSKMTLPAEAVELYANKMSKGLRIFGAFYVILGKPPINSPLR